MEAWFNAHNYPYVKIGNTYYWQTAVATGELREDGEIWWHDRELYEQKAELAELYRMLNALYEIFETERG